MNVLTQSDFVGEPDFLGGTSRRVFVQGIGLVGASLLLATLGGCEKLAKQIKDEGGEAAVFAGDVAKAEAAEAMAAFAVKTYGRLDILHNNVGIGAPGTPETVTPAHPRRFRRCRCRCRDLSQCGEPDERAFRGGPA